MKIVVIGAGIAGIFASHRLAEKNEVTLIEKNDYLGGHTNTRQISYNGDKNLNIDTGFIVCNKKNYPRFYNFLNDLNVTLRDSEMSFGYDCLESGLQYAGPAINDFIKRPRNFLKLDFLKFILEQRRFNKTLLKELEEEKLLDLPIQEKIKELNLSNFFVDNYLVPLIASIWSSSGELVLKFPTKNFARFFKNHGMLEFNKRPMWQTVMGGSSEYIKAFTKNFKGTIISETPVQNLEFLNDKIHVATKDHIITCDKVIFAAHADETYNILRKHDLKINKELSKWRYSDNEVVLHTDKNLMPRDKDVWSSWNYISNKKSSNYSTITYYMNKLQGLKAKNDYFVTLNRTEEIKKNKILYKINYTHPIYTPESLETQNKLESLNGEKGVYLCGSYLGYGFHEDAVLSAEKVVKKILV